MIYLLTHGEYSDYHVEEIVEASSITDEEWRKLYDEHDELYREYAYKWHNAPLLRTEDHVNVKIMVYDREDWKPPIVSDLIRLRKPMWNILKVEELRYQ